MDYEAIYWAVTEGLHDLDEFARQMSTLETFTQMGFQAALIQKKGDIRDYLDTAWTISALRDSFLFAGLLY